MATTTKSKSTRTTKKPATTAKKTTKTTTVKPAAKAPVETVVKPVITPLDRLKSVHVSMALAFTIFAGLIAFAVSTAAVGVTLAIQAKDEFASLEKTILGPANEVLFNVEPKYVLVASLLVSVVASVLFASKARARYESTIANATSGIRWVVTGISSALLITYVNLTVGITDVVTLLLSGGFILAAAWFALFAERDNIGATQPRWLAYGMSLCSGAAAWLPAAGALIGTAVFSAQHNAWYVYAIAGLAFVGFALNAVNQRKHLKNTGVDYVATEARYLNIDLFTKFVVVIISLIALQ